MTWLIDRSGILTAQKCPRARYWERHYLGQGIQRKQKSLPLVFGAAFHEGSEVLLDPTLEVSSEDKIDFAVIAAQDFLNGAFAASGVDLEEKQTDYAINEQKAIAEGLLRAWWLHSGQQFLRDFEVLEVEKEGRAVLVEGDDE